MCQAYYLCPLLWLFSGLLQVHQEDLSTVGGNTRLPLILPLPEKHFLSVYNMNTVNMLTRQVNIFFIYRQILLTSNRCRVWK